MLKLTKVVTRILKRRKKDGVVSFFFFIFRSFLFMLCTCTYTSVLQKRKQRFSFPLFIFIVHACINICMHASVCVYGVLYSVRIVHVHNIQSPQIYQIPINGFFGPNNLGKMRVGTNKNLRQLVKVNSGIGEA